MLPVAVARSSSDGVTICYVLPVIWMTAYFYTMQPMGKIKYGVMLRRVLQVAVPDGPQTYAVKVRQNCGTGVKAAVYDYLVVDLLYILLCNKPITDRTSCIANGAIQ